MGMKIIKDASRHQVEFSSLEEGITPHNAVRIIDAFVEKLELSSIGVKQNNSKKRPAASAMCG
jgi:hypothetical protein